MIEPFYKTDLGTLYNADCIDILKDIPDGSVDLVLTDEPYGVTPQDWDKIFPFEIMWKQFSRIRKEKTAVILFGTEPFSSYLRISNIKEFKYDWIWNKKRSGNPMLSKFQPLKIHEIISVFFKHNYYPVCNNEILGKFGISVSKNYAFDTKIYKSDKSLARQTGYPKSILEFRCVINLDNEKVSHPTQKPVKLFEYLIQTYTNENDIVLDCFAGSGTTGLACEKLNRKYILIEISKEYCEIAKARIKVEAQQGKLLNEM